MLINSLFLSKLLNLKTDKQSTDKVEDGFSYLFSEIIKVKTTEEPSSVVQENIGGTLLDHKIVFISNSSPLENKSVSNTKNAAELIEGLFKLFSAQSDRVSEDSKKVLNLNNIITDKQQFVTSIISLIQNILTNNLNQDKAVEFRYVSENMVETKKVNENNLNQFADFLSGIIENKPTFSFVIGSNSKQILFDVENLTTSNNSDKVIPSTNLKSEGSDNDLISAETFPSESINKSETDTIISIKTNSDDSSKTFEAKNNNQRNENTESQNTRAIKSNVKDYSASKELKLEYDTKINYSTKDNSDKKLFEITSNNDSHIAKENSDSIHQIKIQSEKENRQYFNSSSQASVNPKFKVYDESETKIEYSVKDISIEKPQIKFEDVGEVKIVIRDKYSNISLKSDNKNLSTNYDQEPLKSITNSDEISLNQPDLKAKSTVEFQKFTSITKTETDFTEKDLPKVISLKTDEPKISRAGLPLVADYQDWDIVFEDDVRESVEHDDQSDFNNLKSKENYSGKENTLSGNENSDTDVKSAKFIQFSESTTLSPLKNNSANQDVDEAISNIPKFNDKNVLKEENKILHLKFSGDKKIITITEANNEKPGIVGKQNFPDDNIKSEMTLNESNNITSEQKESGTDKKNIEQINPQTKTVKIVGDDLRSDNNNLTKYSNKEEFVIQKPEKSAIDKKEDFSNSIKSEFQNSIKAEVQNEIKTQLINNKTIVEHFIKNPVVSKTIERFIQIIDTQEAIHKSEIVNYSKQDHSVEIKLAPEELGRIKILIDTNDNNVSAKIEVGNEQAKAIVVNNLPQLKETLSQQGVNLNSVNVTVSSEEQKNPEQTRQKSRKKSQENHSRIESAEEKKTVRNLGYNTYEYLA